MMSVVSSFHGSEGLGPTEALDLSARQLERMMGLDTAGCLSDRLGGGGMSGLHDRDYPGVSGQALDNQALKLGVKVTRVPLPAELVEHFGHMQCNCSMGLFTSLERAWLTIDSDIYVWRYEDGGDLAYFDGLSDTILNVCLVKPKPGLLQPHVVHLLALSTPVEIVLLGVSLAGEELQLVPEPLFSLAADQLHTSCIVSGEDGRIFMGGRDGHLYEFCYSAQDSWWGKKTNKVCHTANSLSWLLPGFLGNLAEEDPILQIELDETRHILYTRSEKGQVAVFYLGTDGQGMERVAVSTAQRLVEEASKLAATIETGNLKPIVNIGVVSAEEDNNLHLVALTGGGARLYLSTGHSGNCPPNSLRLVHVRLPPGFSPSAPPQRPVKVHSGYSRLGLTVLASSPAEAADVLWLISPATMPGQSSLMEAHSTVSVEGHAWAMSEVVTKSDLSEAIRSSFSGKLPPAAAVQHCTSRRKIVVMSAQGAIILEPGRPMDCLRQLLLQPGAADSEAVQAYWGLQGPELATATALNLATSQAILDRQVSDWATRAIILHGGEPRLVFSGGPAQPSQFMSPAQQSFHPAVMSTPAQPFSPLSPYHHPHHLPSHSPQPEVQFSPRHNGLYLYLSRLLRPVWSSALLSSSPAPASVLSLAQLSALMASLQDLVAWLEQNSVLCSGQDSRDTAVYREKQSLVMLRQLVSDVLQFLGLWALVVEHTLELILTRLGQETLLTLRQATLRDLVVSPSGREVAVKLVQALVETYLSDSASTDAISNRLRQLCPSLYRQEDALSSKAHELLLAAAKLGPGTEKEKLVGEAVTISVQIAGHLHLEVLVSHLAACQAYTRLVEVCLAAAGKRDPSQLGLHYYNSGENSEDSAGLAAFLGRTDCYKHCTNTLHTLLQAAAAPVLSPRVPATPGPPPPPSPALLEPDQATVWAEQVFQSILASSDQLLHVALYQWLIENKYIDRLLNIKSKYLEEFLKRGTVQHPETMAMFDLLWKYYEKNSQYVPAAKILAKLADRHSRDLSLASRVQYLSRAVMCVKSSEGGSANRAAGELLHQLDEKMEVARVQLQILEAVTGKPEAEAHIGSLNSDLLDITTLYKDWAEPYQLWECKLAILQCAGHPDQPLVNSIWTQIIQNQEQALGSNKIAAICNKMETLGRQYASSTKYFPLELIVRQLEILSCREKAEPGWVPSCLQSAGVPLPRLLDVYNRLYTNKDSVWLTLGDSLHVLKVLSSLLQSFSSDPTQVAPMDRRQFTVVCQDAISTYLGELYMKQTQETSSLVAKFRDIQTRLDRI